MPRVITIAVAEFEQAVRSRAFLLGLLAVPLLMALAFGIQALTARRDTSERHFAIVDRTGAQAAEAPRLALPDRVRGDGLSAFVEIPPEVLSATDGDEPRLQYYTEY